MNIAPKLGLKGKATLSLGLLLALALLITGGSSYWQAYRLAMEQALEVNSITTQRRGVMVGDTVRSARHLLLTLRDTPPVQGIVRAREAGGIDPLDKDSMGKWQDRMERIFAAFMQNDHHLTQIRYLDETGMEMVRVESDGVEIRTVPPTGLQNKADSGYFKAAIRLKHDETHYSALDLNREGGRIEVPHKPVFRVAAPVFNPDGKLRGVIVVNFFGHSILSPAIPLDQERLTYVVNQDGYYLLHPDESKTLGFDLGFDFRLRDELPSVARALSAQDNGALQDEKSASVITFQKVFFDPADHQRYWAVIHRVPAEIAFKNVDALRQTLLFSGLLIMLASLLLILWLANLYIVSPVVKLAAAARRMREGDLAVRLPVEEAGDEFRTVYQTINEFAEAQQQATTHLEQQIAERTAHLSCIVGNLVDGLITIDGHGIVQSFNPAAEHIFGYRAGEVTGRNVSLLMPEPYHSQHDGYLRHYLDTGEKKILGAVGREVAGKRKDGSIFPLELAVSEMNAGETRQFLGTVRDITERKAAENLIAEKQRELEMRGRYDRSYALAMAQFSTTYDQQQALSSLLAILADNHPYPVSAIYAYDEWSGDLELAVAHGAPASIQKSFERGAGLIGRAAMENTTLILDDLGDDHGLSIETGVLSFRPAAVLISPIRFQENLKGVLVLASSKPLQKMDGDFIARLSQHLGVAMNNLKQHADLIALSEQLKKRGEQIERQNAQLEQAGRTKSEFMANMSHELRTPLNAIIGFSEVLKDGVMGELNAEQSEYVGDIFTSGQHLLSLINDILDLSKIEAGKMELDIGPVDVAELLGNSLSVVRERAVAHQVRLETEVAAGIGNCLLDARKFKQIAFNLLSNAVKFTPDGGSVRLAAQRIPGSELANRRPAPLFPPRSYDCDFLEISVTDSGIGIRPEDQQKLFNAFTQLDSSLARKYEGTGLGLVMVKHIAELHGGTVGLASEPGRGSTFTVWLEYRAGGGAAPAHKPDTAARISSAAFRVLIVEDDDHATELIRRQLEDEGYTTRRAASAEEALNMLAEEKPDLITLDILLPGIDGWDFLALLNSQKDFADIPVVIVSIMADSKRGFSLGASQVLQKPVRKADLLAAVAEVSQHRGWAQQALRILVADDDPKAVEYVSRHLENAGCTVYKTFGGAEAIEMTNRVKPDLIILDLMMPEVTGFDVVQALKMKPETALTPIIILTAKAITAEDRKKLNGDVLKIVEKSRFNDGAFIAEIRRARKLGAAAAGASSLPAGHAPLPPIGET